MKLEERIIQNYRTKDSNWHQARVGVYHASQIWKFCENFIPPDKFFDKEKMEETSIFNFWIGTMYHDAVQKMYPEAEKEVELQIPLLNDAKIIGRCDMILGGLPVELKTCSSFPKEPYPAAIYQINCYLHALGKPEGIVSYIIKSQQEVKTKDFSVKYDKKLVDFIIKKIEDYDLKLKEYVKKKDEPRRSKNS